MRRLVLFLVLAAACGRGGQPKVVIHAAASLREAFTEIGAELERRQGIKVTFNFAGSQELRAQIEQGAPAAALATADQATMKALHLEGKIFAHNEPVLIVPKGQTAIQSLADLPSAKRFIIGAPQVPVGRYALQILANARLDVKPVSHELNVRQILAKVSLGEADAGIVYMTDAATARDKVEIIAIPSSVNVVAEYPIVAMTDAGKPFVELVFSPAGQAILARRGFLP